MPGDQLVVVLDSDESAREATVDLVRALGFMAVGFSDAAEFLNAAETLRPACVIADAWMSGMGGLELHRRLSGAGLSLPVVLVSAYPDRSLRSQALDAGVRCFLAKPLEAERLIVCLREALGCHAGEPAACEENQNNDRTEADDASASG